MTFKNATQRRQSSVQKTALDKPAKNPKPEPKKRKDRATHQDPPDFGDDE